MGPKICVGVDDRAVGDSENLSHGDWQKGEGPELGVLLEVVVGASANKRRSPIEPGEAL